MKKQIIWCVLMMIFLALASLVLADSLEDVKANPSCKYCGMDRHQFAHSRMVIEYDDGTKVGVCSLHCAAIDLSLNIDKTPQAIWVADYNTKKLIEAEKASWVIDPAKPETLLGLPRRTVGIWRFSRIASRPPTRACTPTSR